jgi:hypothetical protein
LVAASEKKIAMSSRLTLRRLRMQEFANFSDDSQIANNRQMVFQCTIKLTILLSWMIRGAEHLVVSAIELVPGEDFCTTTIGRVRL